MLAVWNVSVLFASSTHLSLLRLCVDTIMAIFSSNFSTKACIVWLKFFSMIDGLMSAKVRIAWNFGVITYWVGVWAKQIMVWFSSNCQCLCNEVSIQQTSRGCRRICLTAALRHCMWHCPACLFAMCLRACPKLTWTMLSSPNNFLMVLTMANWDSSWRRLLATNVVLMCSSYRLLVSWSCVPRTLSFSWL